MSCTADLVNKFGIELVPHPIEKVEGEGALDYTDGPNYLIQNFLLCTIDFKFTRKKMNLATFLYQGFHSFANLRREISQLHFFKSIKS